MWETFFVSYSLAVAAATDHQKRDNDYPDEVIIKKIAKAVIHDRTSLNCIGAFLLLVNIL